MPCQLPRYSFHTWCVFQVVSSARSGLPAAQHQTHTPARTTATVWMAQL